MPRTIRSARPLAAALLAVLLLAAASLTPGAASAGPPPPPPHGPEVTLTKKLVGPTNFLPEQQKYIFSYARKSLNDSTDPAALARMPDFGGQTLTIGTNNEYNSKKVEGPTTTLRRDLRLSFDFIPFDHAGVYKYTLTEVEFFDTIGPVGADRPVMSQASYTLTFYVKNVGGHVEIDQVTVEQDTDDDGGPGAGKVDPTPGPGTDTPDHPGTDVDGGSDLLFVNKIVPGPTKFRLKKTVVGDYGDQSRDFDLALTLAVPSTAAPVTGYTGTINGQAYQFAPGATTPFKLRHGQELSFTDLPWGSELTYTETGVAGYTASSSTIVGAPAALTQTGAEGADFTLDKVSLAETPNSSELTNTYKTVTPTGIAMSILPYVVMIAVPALAAAGHLVHRRRMARRS